MANQADKNEWCFAWAVSKVGTGLIDRGTLIRGAKWNRGDVINISFLDDEYGLRDKVKEIALQWTDEGAPGMANLKLVFRKDTTDTLMRISFKKFTTGHFFSTKW